MAIAKMVKKLGDKGITPISAKYERGCPVPEGYANGYVFTFSEALENKVWEADKNVNFETTMELDNSQDVFEWIETLPNIKAN
jgi:hypothetical protein|tara:strand:- start:654 stop:902 length:249 start_codon:yes stop_codon:yes gene_type:complete